MNRAPRAIALVLVVALTAIAGSIAFGPSVSAREPLPARTPKPHPRKTPSPSPTPTPTPTPSPTPTPRPSPTREETTTARRPASSSTTPGSETGKTSKIDTGTTAQGAKVEARQGTGTRTTKSGIWWDLRPSFGGTYTTATLMSLEDQLREAGASKRVLRDVYSPFIIGGAAEFSDTWGAVRHHTKNSLRPHLGQDVFCQQGAPVLAAEDGRVEFATDDLGGTVVRLHRDDGGYWYYAHLSSYAEGLSSGDLVRTGDVIGHCGATGNAAGGSPHVHFGSYPGPENPMFDLVSWLRAAERDAARALRNVDPEAAEATEALPLSPALPAAEAIEEPCVVPNVATLGVELLLAGPGAWTCPAQN